MAEQEPSKALKIFLFLFKLVILIAEIPVLGFSLMVLVLGTSEYLQWR